MLELSNKGRVSEASHKPSSYVGVRLLLQKRSQLILFEANISEDQIMGFFSKDIEVWMTYSSIPCATSTMPSRKSCGRCQP